MGEECGYNQTKLGMKLATNTRKMADVGFQLILEDSHLIGVNLLLKKKILLKKRFNQPIIINTEQEEKMVLEQVFCDVFKKYVS